MNKSHINCDGGKDQLPELILALRKKLHETTTEETGLDYLQNIRTDDEFLARFLRIRGHNLHRAYKSVLNYYQFLNSCYADILSDPNTTSANVAPVFRDRFLIRLNTKATNNNSVTVLMNASAWDTNKFKIYNFHQAAAFLFQDLSQQLEAQLNGCSGIIDFQGLSFKHVRQLTPMEAKKGIYTLQNGIPIRVIGIHLINYPPIFWSLYNIAKLFLKEKMKKRIHFHSNLESLHGYFHKEYLPTSLGGLLEDSDLTDHNAMVKNFELKDVALKEYFLPLKQDL